VNYKDLDIDFIQRTLKLISQYNEQMKNYPFEDQLNHTLLINCLLGLIIFPKERSLSFLPKLRLTKQFLSKEMGINDLYLNTDIVDLKDLIIALRNSIAHCDIEFKSENDKNLIDRIIFSDAQKGVGYTVANFKSEELLPFIQYYANYLLSNLQKHRK